MVRIWTDDEKATLTAMWTEKATYKAICETFGISKDMLRRAAYNLGLPKRKTGRPTLYEKAMPRNGQYMSFLKREHPEHYRELRDRRNKSINREAKHARDQKYYSEHKDEILAKQREYYRTNEEARLRRNRLKAERRRQKALMNKINDYGTEFYTDNTQR